MNFNKVKIGGLIIGACIALMACASATVTEPSACDSQSVSFPVPSIPSVPTTGCSSLPSVTIPSESTTTTLDLSGSISKINSVASNLNVDITALSIDNSNHYFDWVAEVDVYVSGNSLPNALLAKYVRPSDGAPSELEPTVEMSPSDTFKYLSSGPLTFTLTLAGQSVTACQALSTANDFSGMTSVSSSLSMCIDASGKVTKSLP